MDFLSIGAGILQGMINLGAVNQQNQNNMQLARYQNAFNLDLWNRQNEYNTPGATMQRLVEAGVNPRAYNQLGQFANSADAPQAVSYDKIAALSAFFDVSLTMAQIENIQSQTAKNNADVVNKNADTANKVQYGEQRKESFAYEINNLISEHREKRLKNEVWARERGFSMWKDLDDFETKEFANYIEDVIQIRKGQRAGYEELNALRNVQKQLQQQEFVSFENIPKEYRYLVETFAEFMKVFKSKK